MILLLAFLAGVPIGVRGAEETFGILKAGSQVYTNVTVTGHTPTVLYIQHAKGIGSVKLKDLAPELQKKFGFDPVKAAEVESLQQQSQADYAKAHARPPQPKPDSNTASPSGTSESNPSKSRLSANPYLNQRGPPIVFEKWMGDAPEVQGKFVLLEFWATWSGPCRQSIPGLNELHRSYGDRLVVVGLSDETEEAVRQMTDPPVDYYSAIDTLQRTSSVAGVRAVPHALLMDPKGIVRFEGHPGALRQQELHRILTEYAN